VALGPYPGGLSADLVRFFAPPFSCPVYAPINVKPHYPPPGLTRGFDGDLTFFKIKYSTHRGTTGGQISVTMAGMHFRKLLNSYRLRVENCQLKARMIKCPTIGANIFVQIESKSPTNPLLSPGEE